MTKEGNRYSQVLVFAASSLGMLLFGVVLITLGSILPFLRERFELSELATGSLLSTLPFGLLIGSIVFGPLVDRFGYKMLLIICGLLIVAGIEGIALASNLNMVLLSVFVIGLAGGAINGGTNALVADISEGRRGANLSLLGVFFGVGALGMPVILGLLIKYLSYTDILMGVGLSVLIPVIYFITIKFPLPKQPQGVPIKDAFKLVGNPIILLLGAFLFLQSGVEGLTNNWSTTFLQNEKGFFSQEALFSLSFFVAGLTFTRLVLSWAIRLVQSHVILLFSIGLSLPGSLMMNLGASPLMINAGLVILGAGFAAAFPIILGYVGALYTDLSGTAFSIVLALGLIGNMLCNYLMGVVSDLYGMAQLPFFMITCLIFQVFLVFILVKKSPGIKQSNQ